MNARNLIRSATAPETIVAAVPAKTSWKKNFAAIGTEVQSSAEKDVEPLMSDGAKPVRPMSGLPFPNISPKPMSQKANVETAKTT